MPTSIAILGATGLVGSTLAAQILRSHLLEPGDRLQLVGHGSDATASRLLSLRIDLLDAFDNDRVDVEAVPAISDVDADVVVVSSGVPMSPNCNNRRDMGFQNRGIFTEIAEKCAVSVPGALFVVVSNPVELAVKILCTRLDPRRVVGMGAQQDSLRFARAIAHDLGISRREVRASVAGEHGQAMVPLWSSVTLLADDPSLLDDLERMKQQSHETPLAERVARLQGEVTKLVQQEYIADAFAAAQRALPDARIFVEPFITAHEIHSTPNSTANATLECLHAARRQDRRSLHGQVLVQGETLGINGVCGLPISLGRHGWCHESVDEWTSEEMELIRNSSQSINRFAEEVLTPN